MYYIRYITAGISRQIEYGRNITTDAVRQIYYGRCITADILWQISPSSWGLEAEPQSLPRSVRVTAIPPGSPGRAEGMVTCSCCGRVLAARGCPLLHALGLWFGVMSVPLYSFPIRRVRVPLCNSFREASSSCKCLTQPTPEKRAQLSSVVWYSIYANVICN